jgi:hypothetical protein
MLRNMSSVLTRARQHWSDQHDRYDAPGHHSEQRHAIKPERVGRRRTRSGKPDSGHELL